MAIPERPVKPPLSTADTVVSVLVIVVLAGFGVVAASMGFLMLAFTDTCPTDTCSVEAAIMSMLAAFVVGVVVAIGGSIVTIVRLVRRKPAWPWAVGTLAACGVIAMAGFVGYLASVGGL